MYGRTDGGREEREGEGGREIVRDSEKDRGGESKRRTQRGREIGGGGDREKERDTGVGHNKKMGTLREREN